MITLQTPRLNLRPFTADDAADLLEYLSSPIPSCFAGDKVTSIEAAVAKIAKRQKDEGDYLAVCLNETGKVIGEIFYVKEEPDTYSVGWNFNAQFHGKGYASESAQAFIDYLFDKDDARRVYAYVEVDNVASQKLCERLGMRKEGHFVEFISFIKNADGTPKYEDTLQYAILKKEWQAKRDAAS
ncbi:GNAT family N-acetyltransferase [Psychrobacter aestuarii]|uniref:GNAT family N-acetyltransferase n=1 Tax=Psychrobacter aestuarii TaxID=556327 RepID=A0ABN0VSH4_9GAMM|nr:GNAT family protein [Psychrobacter aestuarii]